MKIIEGFLLGLSTGTSCIMSCYPLILPFLFSNIEELKKNNIKVLLFILGRFVSYILVGGIIGIMGFYALRYIPPEFQINLKRISWVLAGFLLFLNGIFFQFPELKLCTNLKLLKEQKISSFILGILAGMNLCPPFLVASARVFALPSNTPLNAVIYGIAYFILFFLGTSIFILPLLGFSFFNKLKEESLSILQYIARFTLIILGIYFLVFEGLIFFFKGS